MRNITSAFKRALWNDRRDYQIRAVITLADGTTVLNGTKTTWDETNQEYVTETVPYLTNENIWDNGFSFEDAVSNDNNFDVGAAIINQAKLVLNNIYDTYSDYDFWDAKVEIYVGMDDLDDGNDDEVLICTVTVDDVAYNGSVITLTCLDNMAKFDKPYTGHTTYPATLATIVRDACTQCGVTLASTSSTFPNSSYIVDAAPSGESTTYRQVLSWCAQIAGCFARCNSAGELELKWYDQTALMNKLSGLDGGIFDDASPYASGDTADGGSFNPWNTGYAYDAGGFAANDGVHILPTAYSVDATPMGTSSIVITGVKVIKKVTTEGSSDSYVTYTHGTNDYMVVIENNDLIQGTHGQDIANYLGARLENFAFRRANIVHPNDPTIEAGDVAIATDLKGETFPVIVSSTTFSPYEQQNTSSSAATYRRNSATRFTEAARNYVALRQQLAERKTAVDEAFEELAERIANSSGLYVSEVTESGATKYYYHDKPLLAESEIVMLFSTTGFTMTADYQTPQTQGGPTWYGMTVDGQYVADRLAAHGVNADWIDTGKLVVKDANNNETFYADVDTGEVRVSGTMKIGGANNVRGILQVYDAQGNVLTSIDRYGLMSYDSSGYGTIIDDGAVLFRYRSGSLNTSLGSIYGVLANTGNLSSNGVEIIGTGILLEANLGSATLKLEGSRVDAHGTFYVDGTITKGTKSRLVEETEYGNRLLYAYETPTPYFGDIGTGQTDEDGTAFISIDDIFDETVNTNIEYSVFLQKEGPGDIWVDEKSNSYFTVKGTPNMKFSWEVKAVQKGFETLRLDDDDIRQEGEMPADDIDALLDAELAAYDAEMEELYQ